VLPPASAAVIARSAVWRVIEMGGGEGLTFAFMIVLTRLLTPADYGVVAIATMTLMLAQLIVRHGLLEALVQRPELTSRSICAALYINLGLGVGLSLALVGLAAPLATLIGEPDLEAVLLVLAWLCIPQSVISIYVALLRRALDFRGLALRAVFAVLIGSLVAVGMALAGYGLWSLVALQVVNALVSVVVVIVSAGWLPAHRTDFGTIRELMRDALPLMGAGVVGTLGWILPTLAFGVALPAAVVGHFFIAQRLMMSLNGLCTASVGDLSLSVLARLQGSAEQHRAAARRALQLGGLVCLPAFAGVAMVAEPLVSTLFGARWADSIVPLQLLMASSVAVAAASISAQILLSLGHHRLVLRLNMMAVLPPAIAASALATFGLVPALTGSVVVSVASLVIVVRIISRVLSVRPATLLADQLPTLAAVTALMLALLAFDLADIAMSPPLGLLLRIGLGGLVFVVVIAWRAPQLCRLVVDSISRALRDRSRQVLTDA
jgi:O-antigen/teichoic acid export membrane protein